MTIRVERQTSVTEHLAAACARLMPQLSERLTAPDRAQLGRIVGNPQTALFAAFSGEELIGLLALVLHDLPSGRRAWIEDVVVDSAHRGLGAGRALMQAALAHAAEAGAGQVQLTSAPHREAARALYRKLGFRMAETSVFVFKTNK